MKTNRVKIWVDPTFNDFLNAVSGKTGMPKIQVTKRMAKKWNDNEFFK